MIRALLLLFAALLTSCSTPKVETVTQPKPALTPTPSLQELTTVNEQTAEEKAAAALAAREYFTALVATIKELDDFTTSADVIARAAVNKNRALLLKKSRAQLAHFKRSNWFVAQTTEEYLASLPKQVDFDNAVEAVLRLRKSSGSLQSSPPLPPFENREPRHGGASPLEL